MFVARGIGISLAMFLLVYVAVSVAVSRMWHLLRRALAPRTTWAAANLLFALRIFPFALASIFTLVFTLPSFLWLEPRSTDEAVGTAPFMLGLCCLALLAAGLVQAARAQIRTSRALMQWLDGADSAGLGGPSTGFSDGPEYPVFDRSGCARTESTGVGGGHCGADSNGTADCSEA